MATTSRDKFVAIRLTSAEHQAIKVRAARKGVTMSEYVHTAMKEYHQHSAPEKTEAPQDI